MKINKENPPSHEAPAGRRKVLIISMKAGYGHIKAGQALLDYAKTHLPNIEASHVDIADIDPSFKKHTKIYDIISKKIPLIWGIGYKIFNVKLLSQAFKKVDIFSYFLGSYIKNYITKTKPDVILFTNVMPLPLFGFAFHKAFPNIKLGVVVTDYHGHFYYHFPFVDYYFVGSEAVAHDLIKAGTKKEKITVTGIPISPSFFVKQDKAELKIKYGISNDLPIVLLTTSFKIPEKDLLMLVSQLLGVKPEVNVIILTNNNQKFYHIIKNNFVDEKRLHLVLWTDAMHEYMKLSDVVITKAGGLTVSECLILKEPMIIINPILGQEEYNAEFVQKNNFGKWVKNVDEIAKVLPEMILLSKNKQMDLLEQENPCKKIFNELF